jgi:hypothetical protein
VLLDIKGLLARGVLGWLQGIDWLDKPATLVGCAQVARQANSDFGTWAGLMIRDIRQAIDTMFVKYIKLD